MNVSIVIATCGEPAWEELAWTRAFPSADRQGALEVLVHHDPDADVETARNVAASQARGEWLCFLDADDELAPGYLRQMRWADVCGLTPALLIPSVCYVHADGSEEPPRVPNTHQPFTTLNHAVIGTLVPRALFERVGGFSTGYGPWEDWHLWLKCLRAGAELVYAPRAVYRAHVHADSRHRAGVTQAAKLKLHRRITSEHRRELRGARLTA